MYLIYLVLQPQGYLLGKYISLGRQENGMAVSSHTNAGSVENLLHKMVTKNA